jgi:hypothetical protein
MWFSMSFEKGRGYAGLLLRPVSYACRVPRYSFETLTEWYRSPVVAHLSLLFQHLTMRVHANLELLEETDVVTKTA